MDSSEMSKVPVPQATAVQSAPDRSRGRRAPALPDPSFSRSARARFGSWRVLLLVIISVVLTSAAFIFYGPGRPFLEVATFDWIQGNWSGGADTSATATYTSDRTTWTKYYSKSSNVTASADSISLSAASGSVTQTTDADFTAGTGEETYGAKLYVGGGSLSLKKQNGRPCTVAAECARGFCTAGVCADPYQYGYCGVGVYTSDGSNYAWKTTNDTCQSPQCTGTLNAGTLASDNNVDFSVYPARNYCKNLQGRLPTAAEMVCILNNRYSLGGNFQNSGSYTYWSGEEASSTSAKYVTSNTLAVNSNYKTTSGGNAVIRCVREIP